MLILLRHSESEYNKLNQFTGWYDSEISDIGITNCKNISCSILSEYNVNCIFTSPLKRCKQTVDIVINNLNLNCKVKESKYLVERHYGALTGLNKDDVKSKYGNELFITYRRSWDVRPPPVENNNNINTSIFENVYSESLEDVYNRVVPYYKENIQPLIKDNNVLIISHGNTLRALYKYLNNISDNDIEKFEIKNNELIFIQ